MRNSSENRNESKPNQAQINMRLEDKRNRGERCHNVRQQHAMAHNPALTYKYALNYTKTPSPMFFDDFCTQLTKVQHSIIRHRY